MKKMKALPYIFFVSCIFLLNCSNEQQGDKQAPQQTYEKKALPRKNIDSLTSDEQAAYLHAWAIIKERSQKNFYDTSGYMWQSSVHDSPAVKLPDGSKAYPGMCEHGTTLFLPWHRAELYYLEQILQQTDPDGKITDIKGHTGPSTRNVTIPYWNWLNKPSGRTFPKMFEDTASVLYRPKRFHELDTPLISKDLVAYQVYFLDWLHFGGGPAESPGFGNPEAQVHNPMHNAVGDDMSETTTAALDPIFYSFHCYFDQLYELWLENHSSDQVTSSGYYLRGTQPSSVARPVGYTPPPKGGQTMGQVKNYFDTRAVGYYYEIGKGDSLPSKEFTMQFTKNDKQFGAEEKSLYTKLLEKGGYRPSSDPASLILVKPFVVPEDSVKYAYAFFSPGDGLDTTNYQVDLYLHPGGTAFSVSNTAFKNKYLVQSICIWGKGHKGMSMEGMSMPATVSLEATDEFNSIVALHKKAKWIVTLVVTEREKISGQKLSGKLDLRFANNTKR